eukprot:823032-Pyramimonas_sp.AAC.1
MALQSALGFGCGRNIMGIIVGLEYVILGWCVWRGYPNAGSLFLGIAAAFPPSTMGGASRCSRGCGSLVTSFRQLCFCIPISKWISCFVEG